MCKVCEKYGLDLHTEELDKDVIENITNSSNWGTFDVLSTYLTNGFWSDFGQNARKWNLTDSGINAKSGTLTYNTSSNWFDPGAGISSSRVDIIDRAFDYLGDITGINFVKTNDYYTCDIAFGNNYSGAFANSVVNYGNINYSYINIHSSWYGSSSSEHDYFYQTVIHEIGHVLGLGHQSFYNGSANFPSDADFANDSWQNSIMSYFSQSNNYNVDADYAFIQTMMTADIEALDKLYGNQSYNGKTFGSSNANTSDNTYGFNPDDSLCDTFSDMSSRVTDNAYCIVDSGGNDTFDLSSYSGNITLDLSVVKTSDTTSSISSVGKKGNITLSVGTVIENAITGSGNDTITGNIAENIISCGDGNDTVNCGAGDDTIKGESGADTLNGDAGDDTINGGAGDDTINGGVGNDTLNGGAGVDTINGGAGVDTVIFTNTVGGINAILNENKTYNDGFGNQDVLTNVENLTGTEYNDILGGNNDVNIFNGGDGDDLLFALGGNDTLNGGNGNDTFYGDAGDDTINGGAGDDTINGGVGNDTLNGGAGVDTINGGAGVDTVIFTNTVGGINAILNENKTYNDGFGNQDVLTNVENLTGTEYNDILGGNNDVNIFNGGDGDDLLFALGGNDTLNGGNGNDTFYGDAGDDTINGGAGDDTINGGVGNDTVIFTNTVGGINAILNENKTYNDGFGNQDVLTNVENLTGTEYNDILGGNNDVNIFNGGDGDDLLFALGGNDTLNGGNGNDTFYGDAGDDTINGGAGDDTINGGTGDDIIYSGSGDDIINGNAGNDTIINNGSGTMTLDGGSGTDIYHLDASNFTTSIENFSVFIDLSTGYSGGVDSGIRLETRKDSISNFETVEYTGTYNVEIIGDAAANSLSGSMGDDTIQGNAGNDTINGGVGNDTLNGGAGVDTINGGAGNDTVIFTNTVGGINAILNENKTYNDGFGNQDVLTNVENLTGTEYNDILGGNNDVNIFNGGDGDDLLFALGGNDTLNGGNGNDTFYGDAGDDTINGGAGDDTINGGTGDDIIYSGSGDDIINGNAGNDTIINNGSGTMTLDGGSGTDIYHLDASNFTTSIENFSVFIDLSTGYSGGVDSGIRLETRKDSISNFETVEYTGTYNVEIIGDAAANSLSGSMGDDTIQGNAGNDTLNGGVGNDTLNGGAGVDTVIFTNTVGGINAILNENKTYNDGFGNQDVLTNVENLTGTEYNDILGGNNDVNIFNGGDGDDLLFALGGNDTLNGGNGNDTFYGDAGDDTINGGAGDDTINGGVGNDTLNGGAGVDTINGGAGVDTVIFTNTVGGINAILNENKTYNDGFGNQDVLTNVENLTGTEYNDILGGNNDVNIFNGGDGDDLLFALGGNDTLNGGNGNDTFYGDAGDDTINGGAGDDTINGGVGNDTLNGGAGVDTINGGAGVDTVIFTNTVGGINAILNENKTYNDGFGNQDVLTNVENLTGTEYNDILGGNNDVNIFNGGDGDDLLFALGGNDTLNGGNGNDTFYGDAGDDTINGGAGVDTINGGVGNDTLNGGAGVDTINGGAGVDTVIFTNTVGGINAILNENKTYNDGFGNQDVLTNVENLTGTEYNDILGGNNDVNIFNGGDGDDLLFALGGNDTLNGGNGNDTFYGDAGDDTINGGAGDDTINGGTGDDIIYSGSGDDIINGNAGNDTIINNGSGTMTLDGGSGTDIYHLDASNFTTSIENFSVFIDLSTGYSGGVDSGIRLETRKDSISNFETVEYTGTYNVEIIGDAAANSLSGSMGDDTIQGNAGNDTINGGVGNDTLNGGAGVDTINGGVGNDTLNGGASVDTINGGAGVDTVIFTNTVGGINAILNENKTYNDGFGNQDVLTNVENLTGTEYNDILGGNNDVNIFNGGDGDDLLFALGGNDTLNGGNGNDTFYGDAGDDTINGGAGDDTINGGVGNDTLNGGAGVDTINGGAGVDTVIFTNTVGGINAILNENKTYNDGFGNQDVLTNVENLTGTEYNDILGGNNDVNIFNGGDGDDLLFALGGNDTLNGGNGNDTFYGDAGDDTLNGGAGVDTINGGAGVDTVIFTNTVGGINAILNENKTYNDGFGNQDVLTNVENLTGTEYNDILGGNNDVNIFNGGDGDDLLFALGGNDTLNGGNGNDTFYGDAGDDTINGGAGDDTINGGTGDDIIYSGSGDDIINGNAGNDTIINNGSGTMTLDGGSGTDIYHLDASNFTTSIENFSVFIDLSTGYSGGVDSGIRLETRKDSISNFETVEYTGTYNVEIIGDAAANSLSGSMGDDTIQGNAGNDTINGGVGNDTLNGGAGVDTINGGVGNDTLNGGAGVDTINGGAGNDIIFSGCELDVSNTITGGLGTDTYIMSLYSCSTTLANTTNITDFDINKDKFGINSDITSGIGNDYFKSAGTGSYEGDTIITNSLGDYLFILKSIDQGDLSNEHFISNDYLDNLNTYSSNNKPQFNSLNSNYTIAIDNTINAAASDADGDTIKYKITGSGASNFTISSIGVISAIATGTYNVTVNSYDGISNTSKDITVNVTGADITESGTNTSLESADIVYAGYKATGQLGDGNDHDWYKIYVQSGHVLTVNFDGLGGIDNVEIRHPDNYTITKKSDIKLSDSVSPTVIGETGFYYIHVNGGGRTDYQFETSVVSSKGVYREIEMNDTFETANLLKSFITYGGQVHSGLDTDYFKINADNGNTLIVKFAGQTSHFISLYDPNKNLISNENFTNGTINTNISETGEYYVKIIGDYFGKFDDEDYSLKIINGIGESGNNNNKINADTIISGNSYIGQLSNNSDSDWYKISLNSDQQLIFDFDDNVLGGDGGWSTHIHIRNEGGNLLTHKTIPYDDTVNYNVTEDGNYYVQIWGAGDPVDLNAYSFNITVV